MTLKRRDWMLSGSYHIWNTFFGLTRRVSYTGHENVPKEGSVLLVPKHQSFFDIPLEGVFLHDSGRRDAYWVLRDNLPRVLDNWGGIRVVRKKDVLSLPKEERRDGLRRMFEINREAREDTFELYRRGEVIVCHLEGTRYKGRLGEVDMNYIDWTREASNQLEMPIPVIPVGIEYSGRSVNYRCGEPIDLFDDNLKARLSREMSALSNLSG